MRIFLEVILLQVKVLGKEERKGVSKAGRDYHFIVLHMAAPARGVIGSGVKTMNVGPDVVDYDALIVPGDFDLVTDLDGHIMELCPL